MHLSDKTIWKSFEIQQKILGGDCGEPLSFGDDRARLPLLTWPDACSSAEVP